LANLAESLQFLLAHTQTLDVTSKTKEHSNWHIQKYTRIYTNITIYACVPQSSQSFVNEAQRPTRRRRRKRRHNVSGKLLNAAFAR